LVSHLVGSQVTTQEIDFDLKSPETCPLLDFLDDRKSKKVIMISPKLTDLRLDPWRREAAGSVLKLVMCVGSDKFFKLKFFRFF
jgi:hypothetical protein